MNFGKVFEIRDLGNHPALTVINLGILLAGDVDAKPDLKRKDLFEVESGSTVYYIYVSPFTGTIFLIATWKNGYSARTVDCEISSQGAMALASH